MPTCKKPCSSDKICNPTSGRCVLKTGKIGLSLAALSLDDKPLAREPSFNTWLPNKNTQCKKPCSSDKICNPASGKCVLKTGKIGKALSSTVTSVKPVKPLTLDEVKAQLETPASRNRKGLLAAMGRHAQPLTPDLAKALKGKAVVAFDTKFFDALQNETEKFFVELYRLYIHKSTRKSAQVTIEDVDADRFHLSEREDLKVNASNVYTHDDGNPVYVFVIGTQNGLNLNPKAHSQKSGVKSVRPLPTVLHR